MTTPDSEQMRTRLVWVESALRGSGDGDTGLIARVSANRHAIRNMQHVIDGIPAALGHDVAACREEHRKEIETVKVALREHRDAMNTAIKAGVEQCKSDNAANTADLKAVQDHITFWGRWAVCTIIVGFIGLGSFVIKDYWNQRAATHTSRDMGTGRP